MHPVHDVGQWDRLDCGQPAFGSHRQLERDPKRSSIGGVSGIGSQRTSTGERIRRGSITHSGDGRLRSKLIQAAWSAIRQDGELRDFYRSVCRTHARHLGPRVAIVAVARKLSARIAVVLMQQRPYIVRKKVDSAPLTQEETVPQGTTRRRGEPGETDNS